MQHLAELSSLLQPVNLSNMVEQHVLYPGPRRAQLVQAMLTRLLNGLDVDALQLGGAEIPTPQGAAQDEHFAQKCHSVLKLLGITATAGQIRGCTGQEDQDIAPLLQMARLLATMESKRVASTGLSSLESRQQLKEDTAHQADAAADLQKVAHLLATAAAQLPKLTLENTQLFPSDMAETLKGYCDQGALAQLPALCQQATQKGLQLQWTLKHLLDAGGAACESAGKEQWQQLVDQLDQVLQKQLQELQAFDTVYHQELSVWAGVADTQTSVQELQQQQSARGQHSWVVQHDGVNQGSIGASATSTGRMARSLMLAYQELRAVMDAVTTIMQQHKALQDVPVVSLQVQRDQHLSAAHNMRMSASAVRSHTA